MAIASDFQLVNHMIPKLFIEVSPAYTKCSEDTLEYFAKSGAGYEDGLWDGEVMLGFRMTSETNPSKLLFEIVIMGEFKYPGKNDEDSKLRFIKLMQTSGAATLIPIARAALISTSTLTRHVDTCSIPNINVAELSWNISSDDQSSNSEGE